MNEQSQLQTELPPAHESPQSRAVAQGQEAEARAGEIAGQARQKAEETARELKQQAQQAGEQIKAQARQAADQAKEKGRSFLYEQKGRMASQIDTYSAAARRAAEKLNQEDDPRLAGYVSAAADRLNQFGRYVSDSSLEEIVGDIENSARRHPEIFYGGMIVAGLLIGRFLKASSKAPATSWQSRSEEFPSHGYPEEQRQQIPPQTGRDPYTRAAEESHYYGGVTEAASESYAGLSTGEDFDAPGHGSEPEQPASEQGQSKAEAEAEEQLHHAHH